MTDVVTLYRNPEPIEIDIDITQEEMEAVQREINMAPKGATITFIINIIAPYDVIHLTSETVL